MSVQLAARRIRLPRIGRFSWLMGLYAENNHKLRRLFAPEQLLVGRHISRVGDGLDVCIDVLEQHPYTTELRLTYALQDRVTGSPDPSAWLRAYHDAAQVEATHCYVGRRWQDIIGLHPPAKVVLDHRLRMNTFLGKWLDYLHGQGHRPATIDYHGALPQDLQLAQPGIEKKLQKTVDEPESGS